MTAPDFERLARSPWPDCLFGILGHQALELGLTAANSAQAFEALMSTMRTASMPGFGGSAPNRAGGSPLSTQRPTSSRWSAPLEPDRIRRQF